MHHPTDRITHTTAFVTPVVEHWLEREIAQWVMSERSTSELRPVPFLKNEELLLSVLTLHFPSVLSESYLIYKLVIHKYNPDFEYTITKLNINNHSDFGCFNV